MATNGPDGDPQQVLTSAHATVVVGGDTGTLNTPTTVPNGTDPATGPAPAINVARQPPPPIPPPVIIPEDVQNSLIENLLVRLNQMGFGPNQPPQQTGTSLPQASEPELEEMALNNRTPTGTTGLSGLKKRKSSGNKVTGVADDGERTLGKAMKTVTVTDHISHILTSHHSVEEKKTSQTIAITA